MLNFEVTDANLEVIQSSEKDGQDGCRSTIIVDAVNMDDDFGFKSENPSDLPVQVLTFLITLSLLV